MLMPLGFGLDCHVFCFGADYSTSIYAYIWLSLAEKFDEKQSHVTCMKCEMVQASI